MPARRRRRSPATTPSSVATGRSRAAPRSRPAPRAAARPWRRRRSRSPDTPARRARAATASRLGSARPATSASVVTSSDRSARRPGARRARRRRARPARAGRTSDTRDAEQPRDPAVLADVARAVATCTRADDPSARASTSPCRGSSSTSGEPPRRRCLANSSSSSRWRAESLRGVSTTIRTSWSPRAVAVAGRRRRGRAGGTAWPDCVPAGILTLRAAVERRHLDLGAERGLREADRHLADDVAAVAARRADARRTRSST